MKYLIFLFIITPLFAAPKKFVSVKEVPAELAYLIDTIQEHEYTQEEVDQLMDLIKRLDYILPHLTKEEAFFLSKSEIYFNVLRQNRNKYDVEADLLNKSTLSTLENLIKKNSEIYSPYALWLSKAILSDLKILFESSLFSVYKALKKDERPLKSSQAKVLDTKLKMLLPWFKKFTTLSPKDLEEELKYNQFDQLKAVVRTSEKLLRFSRFKKLGAIPKDYTFQAFVLQEEETIIEEKVNEENIVENLPIPESPQKKEVKKAENWVPKDLFPKPDPNYKAPDKLPKPIDDWIEDL
ncbi:MAG: hypothetical protein ACO20H_06605 [Bacteriovoracaceae bacterium]